MSLKRSNQLGGARDCSQSMRGRSDVRRFVASLPKSSQEGLLALFLDDQFNLVRQEMLDGASVTSAERSLRDVIGRGLQGHATALILAHNAPAADPRTSPGTFEIAKRLGFLGRERGLQVLDHLIVTPDGVVSILGARS